MLDLFPTNGQELSHHLDEGRWGESAGDRHEHVSRSPSGGLLEEAVSLWGCGRNPGGSAERTQTMTRMKLKVEVSAETTPGKSFATAASHGAFGLMSAMTALDSTTNIQTVIPLHCSQSASRIGWASAIDRSPRCADEFPVGPLHQERKSRCIFFSGHGMGDRDTVPTALETPSP